MMTFSTILVGSQLIFVAADGVPTFNVEPTCKAAVTVGGDDRRKSCLATEKEAREKIAKEWKEFLATDRTRCVETATIGGASRSYVELLTCLELARDVRKLPKEQTESSSTTTSPLEIDARRKPNGRVRTAPAIRPPVDPRCLPPWWT